MRATYSFFFCLLIWNVLHFTASFSAFGKGRTGKRLTIERFDVAGYEEATLVDVEVEQPTTLLQKLRFPWFWKRQGNTAAAGNTGGVGPTQHQNTSSLTTSVNASNSGPAGNNTEGTAPGVIVNTDNPNAAFVNCSDPTTGRAAKCWNELNLTQYVQDWRRTAVCLAGEGFASCFLRQNNLPSLDCSQITVSACPAPESDALNKDAKKFYVVYNIFAINAFFYSWYTAVSTSGSIASDNVGQIVQIIDVPPKTNLVLQDLFVAFQTLFALIPGPLGVFAGHSAFSLGWQVWAQVLSNAIGVAPNVGRFLFPTDTAASQVIQMSELSSNLAVVLNKVQSNLNQTLTSVMANATEFLAFAEQGNFSANAPPLPDETNYLYYGFNTYIISQALNGNNIYAVLGRDTDPHALATNGSALNYDIDCKGNYSEQNVCDTWWYSENYKSAFGLDDFSKANRGFNKELNQLLSNLTTGRLLFELAYECNSLGLFGSAVNITVNANGVNTACISQLRVLTWDMTCTPNLQSNCEFLEQPKQNQFGHDSAHPGNQQHVYGVPYSYLGPGITKTSPLLSRT